MTGARDLTTVMGAVLARCVLLAGLAQTAQPLSLGGKYKMGRVDSLLPRGALRLDDELNFVFVCSVILCCWGRDDRLYLLEVG